MNKLLTILTLILSFTISNAQTPSLKDLFKKTDEYIQYINSEEYEKYELWGENFSETTKDSLYQVTPYRRLIDVRINKETTEKEYIALKKDLEQYYKHNKEVREIYINNGGTLTIDCKKK